jgi:hypothetical protein
MKSLNTTLLVAAVGILALVFSACGEKDEKPSENETKTADKPTSTLEDISKEARGIVAIDDEFAEARDIVEGAGYVIAHYGGFPSQEVNKKGRVLIYTDGSGKRSGGVVYLKKTGGVVAPAWHWYFEDMVPEEVTNVELNNDGLWDLRISGKDGEVAEFIQDESFTLLARDRSDWIAMNGKSSAPVANEFGLWRCFDGDTLTVWKSSVSGGEAFVEFFTPFGSTAGILSIHTLETGQPVKCVVTADGKKIDEIQLKPVSGTQAVQLNEKARKASKIHLAFTEAHGGSGVVEVGEISLK